MRRLGSRDPRGELNGFAISREPHDRRPQRLSWTVYRQPILLTAGLARFTQLSGFKAVFYYFSTFAAAGFDAWPADTVRCHQRSHSGLDLGGIALLDRLGRRTIVLVGSVRTVLKPLSVALVMANHAPHAWLLPRPIAFIASFAVSQ